MKTLLIILGIIILCLTSCSKTNVWDGRVATSVDLIHTDQSPLINGMSHDVDWTFEIKTQDPYSFTWVIFFEDGTTLKSSDALGNVILTESTGRWFTLSNKKEQTFIINITDSHGASISFHEIF